MGKKPFMVKQILHKKVRYYLNDLSKSHDLGQYYGGEKPRIVLEKALKGNDYVRIKVHEELHALWDGADLHYAKIPEEVEEIILQLIINFLFENYDIISKDEKHP